MFFKSVYFSRQTHIFFKVMIFRDKPKKLTSLKLALYIVHHGPLIHKGSMHKGRSTGAFFENGNIVQWKQNLIFFLPCIGILRFFLPFFGILRFLSSLLWYFGIFLCLLWYFGGKCRCKCPRWLSPRLALHLHRATVSRQQKSEKKRRRKFNYTIGFNNTSLRSSNSNSP